MWHSHNKYFFRLLILGVASLLGFIAEANAQSLPQIAPLNPDFIQHQADVQAGITPLEAAPGELAKGLRPSPVDRSHMAGKSADVLNGRAPLGAPVSFDLRTGGFVTSVKDQGNCGSCWTFATMGSLESNMLKAGMAAGPADYLSENHLNVRHAFNWAPCQGGIHDISTAYLGRWGNLATHASGPVTEASDPYTGTAATSNTGLTPAFHAQEVLFFPNRANGTDNAIWKSALQTYGALYIAYYSVGQGSTNTTYWNATNSAYYYNGSTNNANHAVTMVGWDDNYAVSNFTIPPPGPGAYILKNNWGTAWGASGYFYVSYYDTRLIDATAFIAPQPTTNYTTSYSYDPFGQTNSYGYSGTAGWGANVFTATGNETLKAVGLYTLALNSAYEIYIYTDPTTSPTTGTLVTAATTTGTYAYAGYHTATLTTPVTLTAGQKFSVVVKFTTPGYNYPIPVEMPVTGYASSPTSSAGQSYMKSSTATTWSAAPANTNINIRAFTGGASGTTFTVTGTAGANGSISPANQSVASGQTTTLTVTPNTGYTAAATGCGGTLVGTTYTTGAITADCTVSATFTQSGFTVSATAGAGGIVTPASQYVATSGGTTTFTVVPNTGYTTDAAVSGTCAAGSWSGTTYTTGAVTAACSVGFSFTPTAGYVAVTATAGTGGSVSPASQAVASGSTASFVVTASSGYTTDTAVTETCAAGSWSGTTYTTGAVTTACSVAFTFTQASTGSSLKVNILPSQAAGAGGMWRIAEAVLQGDVRNAQTGLPIFGVTVSLFDSAGNVVGNATTDGNGAYSMNVPVGTGYKATFAATGYYSVNYFNIPIVSGTNYLETVLAISTSLTGNGTVSGTITDGLTGTPLGGVLVAFRSGMNAITGTPIFSTSTDAGAYTATLPTGIYTALISSTGYITRSFTVVSLGGQTVANQNASLMSALAANQMRIVLTWGATPYDLDSHMTGPMDAGGRFHAYWYSKTYSDSKTSLNLDVDDQVQYGPETITITQQAATGMYRYSVHDYSNRNVTASTVMAGSGARVKVYKGASLIRIFDVPQLAGNLWTVFEMNGNIITPVNTLSDHIDTATVPDQRPGDPGVNDGLLIQNMPLKGEPQATGLSPVRALVSPQAHVPLTEGTWRSSGETISLAPGRYTVEFANTVSGWTAPASIPVTIWTGRLTTATGVYKKQGALKVTITPTAANTAGAQWNVDGGPWWDSGHVEQNLSAGSHLVSFKAVTGYTAPPDRTVNVPPANTYSMTGLYKSGYVVTARANGGGSVSPSSQTLTPPDTTADVRLTFSSGYTSATVGGNCGAYSWNSTTRTLTFTSVASACYSTFTFSGIPTVTTGSATNVMQDGARLTASVNPKNALTTVTFNYGTTNAYGSSIPAPPQSGNTPRNVSTQLVGLLCDTTYHYRVTATNARGTATPGSDRTFKTAPCSAPSATTVGSTRITSTGATIGGYVDPKRAATTVTFQYTDHATYAVDTYGSTASAGIINGTARLVSAALTGLDPCTMYHFRVTAENANNPGAPVEGLDRTFTTLCADSNPPKSPVSDFGGDGKSDILLRDSATGQTAVWMMNGSSVTSNLATSLNAGVYTADSGWQAQGIGDFDGDRRSDVLWRNASSGQLAVWTMNGATATGAMVSANPGAYTSTTGWQVQGLGDFNADGRSDILFRHAVSGEMSVWFMNGAVKAGGGRLGSTAGAYTATTGWQVHAVGDFNGDSKSDILWRHAGTGQTAVWLMDGVVKAGGGSTTTQAGAYTSTTGWQVQGAGDFNGDGKSDILLRDAETGRMATWVMNGRTVVSSGYTSVDAGPYTSSAGLQVSAIADYNGDGKSDILLRDAETGQTLVWTMSGSQVTSSSATDVSPGAYTPVTGLQVISEETVR